MTQYLPFLLAFAASAAAPGPEIVGVLARALAGGLRNTLALAAGIVSGKLAMLTVAIIGLAGLLKAIGPAFDVLQYAGAAYLIWLGLMRWRRAGRTLHTHEALARTNGVKEVGLGLAMTLSNPIALIFYAALLPSVIDVGSVSVRSYLTLCLILVLVMAAVVCGYGLIAELARKLLAARNSKAGIDRASAVLFVLAGVLIAFR